MIKLNTLIAFFFLLNAVALAQNYGSLKKIDKELLKRDLELLKQGLEKHHSGMYWYTPKDSVDMAFQRAKNGLNKDLNEIEFFNLIAPLVGLSREDHTNIEFSDVTEKFLEEEAMYLPLRVVFLNKKLYIIQASKVDSKNIVGDEIFSINGKKPAELGEMLGELFASDGYIKAVKYSDLYGYAFSKYYFLKFGFVDKYQLVLKDSSGDVKEVTLNSKTYKEVSKMFDNKTEKKKKESLEFEVFNDSTAYLGVHTFDNSEYKKNKINRNYRKFLRSSFKKIEELSITNLIIDVSQNGGGNEGNENLLFSYVAKNYQKYKSVCAKSQVSVLDNGVDKPIKFKTFGCFESVFANEKMPDGSYCRKSKNGFGLMAYKKEPLYKYNKKLFVIISPVTYSGGSEFSNMIRTRRRGVFVGEETGGGYYGNTSGYSSELVLPHSKILIDIPELKFEMNVSGGEFGRGVIPDYEVIPTIQEHLNDTNVPLQFVLDGKASR